MEALKSLQSCLDGKAVHGDLNPSNLLVRYAMCTDSTFGFFTIHMQGNSYCDSSCVCLAPVVDYLAGISSASVLLYATLVGTKNSTLRLTACPVSLDDGFKERKPDCAVKPLERPQFIFLDLAWSGQQGQVIYPPFVNGKAVRTVKRPDGQLISRNHDTQQLKETLGRCRQQQYRRHNTKSQHCASVHACKQHVQCTIFSGKLVVFTRTA